MCYHGIDDISRVHISSSYENVHVWKVRGLGYCLWRVSTDASSGKHEKKDPVFFFFLLSTRRRIVTQYNTLARSRSETKRRDTTELDAYPTLGIFAFMSATGWSWRSRIVLCGGGVSLQTARKNRMTSFAYSVLHVLQYFLI